MNLQEAEKLVEGVEFDFQDYYKGVASFSGRVNGFDVRFTVGASTHSEAFEMSFSAKEKVFCVEDNISFEVSQNGTVVFSWEDPEW